MEVLFLDANILFSAAYQENAGLCIFWKLRGVQLVTSAYAVEEARRNLRNTLQLERLDALLTKMQLLNYHEASITVPETIILKDKDRPILSAAIAAEADFLITGDFKDFGRYFEMCIEGVTILPPAKYFLIKNPS